MIHLKKKTPLFVGYKVDGSLRRRLAELTGADSRYVSREDSTFLRVCRLGEDEYVGKVIDEPIPTDRVDEVVNLVDRLDVDITVIGPEAPLVAGLWLMKLTKL